jgi:hypothetical protein
MSNLDVSEVEIIYVRLLQDGYPKDYFVGLVDLEHAHADGVFTAIDTAMNNHGSVHWKEKVVGAVIHDGKSLTIFNFFSYWVPDGISNKWCKSAIRIDTMLVQ